MMDDLISRRAAIDAIAKYLGRLQPPNTWETWRSTGKVILDIVPPAQPELPIKEKCAYCPHCYNCDVNYDLSIAQPVIRTQMSSANCISRQAAIDVLSQYPFEKVVNCISILEEMPPAQPKISMLTLTVAPDSEEIERVARKIKDEPVMVLPSSQPTYTDAEIQKMQDLESAQIEKAYQLGYEEGKKDAQQEQKIGYWIPVHPLQADDEGAYLCSNCNTGDWDIKSTDKYCKFCGAKMQGAKKT